MKKYFLLITLAFAVMLTISYSQNKGNGKDTMVDDVLRKSALEESTNPYFNPYATSYPYPFTPLNNPTTQPAVSTGYYFVDSEDPAPDKWRPNSLIIDTNVEESLWRRVLPGPRMKDPSHWTTDQGIKEGLRFFRNPALPLGGNYFDPNPLIGTDSTDDAIAGPMYIGFPFYFCGIRYDSFYVSTNGVVALTNRRYMYDTEGNRTTNGGESCYDPMSMDWYNRGRVGDGLTDATPDDWGYTYTVCGGSPANQLGGIRAKGGNLETFPYRGGYIAPFFGDNHLSQCRTNGEPDDFGKVYYKYSNDGNSLIIYYVNIAPVGLKRLKGYPNQYTALANLRPEDAGSNPVFASAQILLNRLDSSVTITYELLDGAYSAGTYFYDAESIFQCNSTCGVKGWARHVNYNRAGGPNYPWAAPDYPQSTYYFSQYVHNNITYPKDFLAIRFKQWKNSLRVVDIQYRVRKQDISASLEFTETVPSSKVNDYELLAGEERIGAIQPVTIIQNLTNDIQGPQGVNYQPQSLNFRARFRIVNLVTKRIVYSRLVPVDSTCLALPDELSNLCTGESYVKVRYSTVTKSGNDYNATAQTFPGTDRLNGIPPYGFVQVFFPPFVPNESLQNHIGRLQAFIIAEPVDPRTNTPIKDDWGFDDTTSVRIFVMRRLKSFEDDVTHYEMVDRLAMPSVLRWVNINAHVTSGDAVSHNPLAPRGKFNSGIDWDENSGADKKSSLPSPVIQMNRVDFSYENPAKTPAKDGDEIRSFPIDMTNRFNSVLSLSIQRGVMRSDYPRGYSDGQLIGPEPRVVVNGDVFQHWTSKAYSSSRWMDYIAVELARPSPDGIQHITNLEDKSESDTRWRWLPHSRNSKLDFIKNIPAFALFGAGGYRRGFHEPSSIDPTLKDSALGPEAKPNLNSLRPSIYDDGIDWEYNKIFVPIPDTFILAEQEGAKNFRFRIKVYAGDYLRETGCQTCIGDDYDDFLVDNVRILFPSEVTDLELSTVKVLWPYTMAPASQCIKIPLRIKISNNTSLAASEFWVQLRIFPPGSDRPTYCREKNFPGLQAGIEQEFDMPTWNARSYIPGKYKIQANIVYPGGGDIQPLNDTNYTEFNLVYGDGFAYDPVASVNNDVPEFANNTIGRGLTLYGFNSGANGSLSGATSNYDEVSYGCGYEGGNGSGQIAMKFHLYQTDTIYGYKAFFATKNMAFDDISFSVYSDQSGQPGTEFKETRLYTQRGVDMLRNDYFFNEYVTYVLNKPFVLPAGTYWITIAQLGETGIELGASKARAGMRTTSIYYPPPSGGASGGSGVSLCIDKNFRKLNKNLDLINENFFAFENTKGSNQWVQFMPGIGNPGYAHLHHYGVTPQDNLQTHTLTRGFWIPMIRPYFGERSYGTTFVEQECEVPVKLSAFNGLVREDAIDIYWETTEEKTNKGFYLERKKAGNTNSWNTITFVAGKENPTSLNRYNYTDRDITTNNTYQYRLRQVDFDGTQSCEDFSDILTFDFYGDNSITLKQNVPNPFTLNTSIEFYVPNQSNVNLDILDVYGNIVKSYQKNTKGNDTFDWDGTYQNGSQAPSGNYIYKLSVGDEVKTMKMTLVK